VDQTQHKPTKEDSERRDEYGGKYKDRAQEASEEEKFGDSQNPVRDTPLPAKSLRTFGG